MTVSLYVLLLSPTLKEFWKSVILAKLWAKVGCPVLLDLRVYRPIETYAATHNSVLCLCIPAIYSSARADCPGRLDSCVQLSGPWDCGEDSLIESKRCGTAHRLTDIAESDAVIRPERAEKNTRSLSGGSSAWRGPFRQCPPSDPSVGVALPQPA